MKKLDDFQGVSILEYDDECLEFMKWFVPHSDKAGVSYELYDRDLLIADEQFKMLPKDFQKRVVDLCEQSSSGKVLMVQQMSTPPMKDQKILTLADLADLWMTYFKFYGSERSQFDVPRVFYGVNPVRQMIGEAKSNEA